MMRKSFLFFLLLMGCNCPYYNKTQQDITILHGSDMELDVEGRLDGDKQTPESTKVVVKRSFNDLHIILKKKGFEKKEVRIKSHWTEDKWAGFDDITKGVGDPKSAVTLLPPVGTIEYTFKTAKLMAKDAVEKCQGWRCLSVPVATLAGVVSGFVWGVGTDIRNLVTLSWPRAVIFNPWFEYDNTIDLSQEILAPTSEFEKKCHAKSAMFIGNNDCLSCNTSVYTIVSTEEECNRCPNRKWIDFKCLHK